MTARDGFWFIAGVLCAAALVLLLLPWLRARAASRSPSVSAPRWAWAAIPAVLVIAGGLYAWLGSPSITGSSTMANGVAANGSGGKPAAGAANGAAAASMTQAVTGLEARLAKNGGSDADWNLLAQSYEFLSRPEDAVQARLHKLPAGAGTPDSAISVGAPTGAAIARAAALPAVPIALSTAALPLVAEAEQARRKRDFRAATALYARLVQMRQMNADTWADYADAQATLDGKLATAASAGYIDKALSLDPLHNKALWLKASLQEETSQFAAAAQSFETLVAQLPAESNDAKLIRTKIAEDLKLAPAAMAAARAKTGNVNPNAGSASSGAGPRLTGEIVLADALRAKVKPGMALFVFAKAVGAAGAPLAVFRTTTGNWPLKFELSDANAMLPGHDLSSAQQVVVEARISQSGQAPAQPGDLQGSSASLATKGAKPLRIVIDKVIG